MSTVTPTSIDKSTSDIDNGKYSFIAFSDRYSDFHLDDEQDNE